MRRGQEQDTHKQAASCKSALPYYYCAQMANSSQQPDQGQTLAILETALNQDTYNWTCNWFY